MYVGIVNSAELVQAPPSYEETIRFIFIINSLETRTHLPRRMDTWRWVDLLVDLRLCKLRHARWTSVVEGVGVMGTVEVDDGVPHGSKSHTKTVRLPWQKHHVNAI